MSINLSSLLKLSVAGAVLLSVGACKAADKGQGALKSKSVAALNLSKSEANVFAKYFLTEPCEIDEMEALGALAGLGLSENGANGMSFSNRTVGDGLVSYSDLSIRQDGSDKASFSAESAVFYCPKMENDDPTFDRVDLNEVSIFDEDEDVEFTAQTLNIAHPTFEAARSVIESMTKSGSTSMNDIGFGAISITGAEIKSEDLSGSLDALSWGEKRDEDGQGKADLTIEDVNFIVPSDDDGQPMTLSFDGLSARQINIGNKIDRDPTMSPDEMMGSVLGNLNTFEKPYDELLVETLKVDAEGFTFEFGGIEGRTTDKSGIVTIRQSLKPSQLQIKPALGENPAFKRNYDILKSLDFETIRMSGSSVTTLNSKDDSVVVSDGLFVIDDAMQFNFEYAAEGLTEMAEKVKKMSDVGSTPDVLSLYEPLKLRNFRLTVDDNSIVSRGLKLATEMTGQSEKSIKRSLGMAVFAAALAAENEVQAEVYSETMEAFADFVKKGGTLTIEANPPAPFPLAPLLTGKGEDVDPEALGFSASQAGGSE